MRLPKTGVPWHVLRERLVDAKRNDHDWKRGRLPGTVYYVDDALQEVACGAYTLFFMENAFATWAFPSLQALEAEVIGMAIGILGGHEDSAGSFTSGGTESIFQAVKTARDQARAQGMSGPANIVGPYTCHPAFDKAAHYLGLEMIRVPVRPDGRADVGAMERAITRNTIMLVGSAPCYTYGVFDPIVELGRLAVDHRVWLHVDACLGGFLAPFVRQFSAHVPPFDLSVPGVASISADLHKYGFAPKGASVVLYRDADVLRLQRFESDRWPSGPYATESFLGSRPGGAVAGAWAVMNYLGEEGYLRIARLIMETKARFIRGIDAIDGLKIVQPGDLSILLYRPTDRSLDTDAIRTMMSVNGWLVSRSLEPPALRLMLTPAQAPTAEEYLQDLRSAVREVRSRTAGSAAS